VPVKATEHKNWEKLWCFRVLADWRRLTPSVTLKGKNLAKELPWGIIFKCNKTGWMMKELVVKRLTEAWDRCPGALLTKRRMLVLEAFKGHLTKTWKLWTSNPNKEAWHLIYRFLMWHFTNHSHTDYITCVWNSCYLSCPLTPAENTRQCKAVEQDGLQWHFRQLKKCCMSNNMNSTADDDLSTQNHEENSSSSDIHTDSDWLGNWSVCNSLLQENFNSDDYLVPEI
jgi:hypothetical protein